MMMMILQYTHDWFVGNHRPTGWPPKK